MERGRKTVTFTEIGVIDDSFLNKIHRTLLTTSNHAMSITIGVLALQGAFIEHIELLKQAASVLSTRSPIEEDLPFKVIEVRNQSHLSRCDALIIPGGESTSIAIVAGRIGLLDPLRDFVK